MQTDIGNLSLAWHANRLHKKTMSTEEKKQPPVAELLTSHGVFSSTSVAESEPQGQADQVTAKKSGTSA